MVALLAVRELINVLENIERVYRCTACRQMAVRGACADPEQQSIWFYSLLFGRWW